MGHGLTEKDRMFSVRQAPWHFSLTGDRTTIHDDYLYDQDLAMQSAGLGWEPMKVQAGKLLPKGAPRSSNPLSEFTQTGQLWVPDDTHCIIVRDDDFATLGTVACDYPLIGNKETIELLNQLLDALPNEVKIETMGSLHGGKKIWALARIDKDYSPSGDPSPNFPYICISNDFTGRGALKATRTYVRVVCWNTFQMMMLSGKNDTFTFHHRGDMRSRLEDAKRLLGLSKKEAESAARLGDALMTFPADERRETRFVNAFIPLPKSTVGVTDRQIANVESARAIVRGFLDSPTTEEIRGTAYSLFQVGVEYLDHGRNSGSSASLLNRTMLQGDSKKKDLLDLALSVSGVDGARKTRVMDLVHA